MLKETTFASLYTLLQKETIFKTSFQIKLFEIPYKQISIPAGGYLFHGMHHSLQLKS